MPVSNFKLFSDFYWMKSWLQVTLWGFVIVYTWDTGFNLPEIDGLLLLVCTITVCKRKIWKIFMYLKVDFTSIPFFWQLEDGHTLFDYNVGLNDIVQLLIRSESEAPTTASVTDQDGEVNPCAVSNCKNKVKKTNSGSPSQPSTSSRSFLIDPGIGLYKVRTSSKSWKLASHLWV